MPAVPCVVPSAVVYLFRPLRRCAVVNLERAHIGSVEKLLGVLDNPAARSTIIARNTTTAMMEQVRKSGLAAVIISVISI